MRYLLLSILLLLPTTVYASHTCNTGKATGGLYSLTNSQANYKTNNGKYEQVKKVWHNHYVYELDEYVSPQGPGYVARAICVSDGKTWVLEQHVGPETGRDIATDWEQREAF